jgi:hypothetical protein
VVPRISLKDRDPLRRVVVFYGRGALPHQTSVFLHCSRVAHNFRAKLSHDALITFAPVGHDSHGESHGRSAEAMGQLAHRVVGLSQRPEGGRVRFRLVREPGGLLGGLPASEQNPPGSVVKDQPRPVNLRVCERAKLALCGVFGRDLRALLVRFGWQWGKTNGGGTSSSHGEGGRLRMHTPFRRIEEGPHPARERGAGLSHPLISRRPCETTEGRWCERRCY